ncbi:MAG: hypothetical protein AB7R89_29615 [Dehalococcoidia bacterium]
MQAIFDVFGWGSNGEFWAEETRKTGGTPAGVAYLADTFPEEGCHILARAEYDVPWYIQDAESLIFYLMAPIFPEAFDPDRHHQQVNRLIVEHGSPRGIRLNEHRELLIAMRDA